MRLAFPNHVLAGPPVTQRLQPVTPTAGLDERVVGLMIGLVIAACVGLIVASQGIVATVSAEPARVATLLALTLALQMFSVQVYGRGSVSVSAIGIVATAILFDTGTTMAIAVVAAAAQWLRRRNELYKGVFDAANFAVSAAAASLVFQALDEWRLLGAVLAGIAYAAVNNGLLCFAMSLAERTPWSKIWFERFHWARFHFALFGARPRRSRRSVKRT